VGSSPVKIEMFISSNCIEFTHSGKPFSHDNIMSLIHQTSMKDRSDEENNIVVENTGKFGTGFITTHLLSIIIEVKGIYYNME
jgi:hypothetical protein